MRIPLAAALAMLTFLRGFSPASAMTSSPAPAGATVPASGGAIEAFDDRCPPQDFLTGLQGHAGEAISQLQMICAPMSADGTLGTKYLGPSHGVGDAGNAFALSCPANSAAFITRVFLVPNATPLQATRVDFSRGSMPADLRSRITFVANVHYGVTSTAAPLQQKCPRGQLGSGFHVNSGNDATAMGLDCEVLVADTASGSAAAPSDVPAGVACQQGRVPRLASPTDFVCVTPAQHRRVMSQNATAANRVSQTDHTYGPNTCVQGFVWREAFSGDVVCVTPRERSIAKRENALAGSRAFGNGADAPFGNASAAPIDNASAAPMGDASAAPADHASAAPIDGASGTPKP